MSSVDDASDPPVADIFEVRTRAPGPVGNLPLTEDMLKNAPSGDIFGLTQNAGMGWEASDTAAKQFLILCNQGGLRAPVGEPSALGHPTGHWDSGRRVQAAPQE